MSEMLTLTQVAGVLRCSKAHISNLINGKVLGVPPMPSLRLGRRKLIRRSTLEAWITQIERRAEDAIFHKLTATGTGERTKEKLSA